MFSLSVEEKRFAKHRELQSRDRKLLAYDEVSGISVIHAERMRTHMYNVLTSAKHKNKSPTFNVKYRQYELRRAGARRLQNVGRERESEI